MQIILGSTKYSSNKFCDFQFLTATKITLHFLATNNGVKLTKPEHLKHYRNAISCKQNHKK